MSDAAGVTVRPISFDAPGLHRLWNDLLTRSDTRPISQTYEFHRVWAGVYPVEQVLLLAAERAGEVVAIAPLYVAGGMVFFHGSGEADYHDIIGAGHDPDVVTALLAAAADLAEDFVGFKLHHVSEHSRTTDALEIAAERLGLRIYEMGYWCTVVVDMAGDPAAVRKAVSHSMRKREGWLRQRGDLKVQPLHTAAEVRPHLPEFYEMHVARWRTKGVESIYATAEAREFLERWIEVSAANDWLRALRVEWEGRTLGMEFAWEYDRRQFCKLWTFSLADARRSPGQILLRNSVLQALDRGVTEYDQGLGDQDYKYRLPSRTVTCTTWGLFPPEPSPA